jgi:hypothetical protein
MFSCLPSSSTFSTVLVRPTHSILPSGSFHSVSPWEPREKWRPFAAVWHGFWGRWRADDEDELQRGLENRTKEALGRE